MKVVDLEGHFGIGRGMFDEIHPQTLKRSAVFEKEIVKQLHFWTQKKEGSALLINTVVW